jgi:hypothetical protein
MMLEALAGGLIIGLTNGVQCTIVCLPILLVQLMVGKKTLRNGLAITSLFAIGRLLVYLGLAYASFTLAQGLGLTLNGPASRSAVMVVLGLLLVTNCYRALKGRARACPSHSQNGPSLALGVASSLLACAPLVALLSLSASADAWSAYGSVVTFWMGSSVYSFGVTAAFLGALRLKLGSSLARRVEFVGALSGGLLGLTLLIAGLGSLSGA